MVVKVQAKVKEYWEMAGRNKRHIIAIVLLSLFLYGLPGAAQAYTLPVVGQLQYPPYISAVAAANGHIYVFGCYASAHTSCIQDFNTATNSTTVLANMPHTDSTHPTEYGGAAAAINGTIYYFGGYSSLDGDSSDIEKFNGSSLSKVGSMPYALRYQTAVPFSDGNIYLFGGYDINDTQGVNYFLKFNPGSNSCTQVASLPLTLSRVGAAAASNGSIYLFGGISGGTTQSKIIKFTPSSGSVTTLSASLPNSFYSRGAATAPDGKIYIFCTDANGTILQFDPSTETINTTNAIISANQDTECALSSNGLVYITVDQSTNVFSFDYTALLPPAAPTLSGTANGSEADLSWTSVSNATTYIVEKSTDGTNWTQVTTTTGTSYTDSNLAAGTYYYRVKAQNGNGTSNPSNVVTITIQAQPPAAPTLSGTANGSEADLSWTSVSGATGYIVEKSTDGTNWTQVTTTTGTSYTDSNLAAGTYYYRVEAQNGSGTSSPSNVVSVTIQSTPPPLGAPTLTATADGTNVDLSWTAVSGATNYILQRSSDGTSWTQVTTTTGTSYTDSNLAAGTYYYRVEVTDTSGNVNFSNVASVTISAPPPPPPTLKAYWPAGGQYVEVDWSASAWGAQTPAGQVQLWRKDNISGIWMPVRDITGSDLSAFTWTDTMVSAGLNYDYQVREYNPSTWDWTVVAESDWATNDRPFAAPSDLQITSTATGSATVTWTPVSGAGSYQVQTSTDGGNTWQTTTVGGPPVTVPRPCQVRVKAGTHARSQWSGVLTVQ